MKKIAEKVLKRNYKKRFVSVLIAALLLTAVSVTVLVTTMRAQLAELRGILEAYDSEEESVKDGDAEHEIKAALRAVPRPGRAAKAAAALSAAAFLLLWLFFRVSIAEWLYKEAVIRRLNRALWPMLGGAVGVLAIPALLVVINDPKRMAAEALK